MDYGLCLPNVRAGASRDGLEAAADVAERLGWSTVWTTDHLVVEHASAVEYGRVFEALTTLAWVGARHPTVRLGTSVIVVPQRNAVVVAKELATLDALSGGRVIAGVGIGWDEAEFANLGVPERFRVRGAYLDEAIALWRHLFAGATGPFEGRFHALRDFVFDPLPERAIPIWVGGGSEPALRRAGRLGDGWQSSALGPASYGRRLATLRGAAEAAGRALPTLSARVRVRFDERGGKGYAMRGTPESVAAEVRAFRDLGVEHLAIAFPDTDPAALVRAAERFASEVAPGV